MELNFDKEIDALLRQTAQGGDFVSNQTVLHLDADEISAFAENALPEKSRRKHILHLADCETCRVNLSNLIALGNEPESETVYAKEREVKEITSSPIPWYRKLFAFPNLAYTLGALILVFSGIAAFTVLQSVNNTQSFEMSQVAEKQTNGKGMNSDGDAPVAETYSSNAAMQSNSATMNSALNTTTMNSSNPAKPSSAPVFTANSNVSVRDEADKSLNDEPNKIAKSLTEPVVTAKTENQGIARATPAPQENNSEDEASKQQPNMAQNSIAQNQTNITPDSRNAQRAPSAMMRAENKAKKLEESGKDDAPEKSVEKTVAVGGKIFKRQNNVWYDSVYRGQPTTNITRGTKEYKKLDSSLREIVERIGGTIVVVWKDKAYRIQ